MRALILALGLLPTTVPAAAVPQDPLGALQVPEDHPRLCITAAQLPELRERLASDAGKAERQQLAARARGYLSTDPANPSARHTRLQPRCHDLAQALATLTFHGLVGTDADRADVSAWLEKLDVSNLTAQLPDKEYMPRGEFLYGFPLAYDWAASWASPAALERLRAIVVEHTRINYKGIDQQKNWEGRTEANNHSMAAMGGVGLAGLALWGEEPQAKAWTRLAAQKVQAYLAQSFDEDGCCYEGNLYGPFGLGMALPFAASLRHLGGTDLFGDGRLTRAIHANIAECIPGARLVMDPRNDASGQQIPGALSRYAASTYRDGLAMWALARADGRTWMPWRILWPVDESYAAEPGDDFRARFHRGRGLLDVRTGFGPDAVFAAFEAGARRKGCHGQSDQGQVTLYAGDAWIAVDPGYSNKKDPDSGNQTLAHNLVLIDGVGQAITGGGKVIGATMLATHLDDAPVVAAKADLKPAYDADGHNSVAKATRTFVWIDTPGRPYVLVLDEIVKDAAAHRFEARWHTNAGNTVAWEGPVATITAGGRDACRIHFAGPRIVGSTIEADWGSWLKAHPVLLAQGQGRAWTCLQVFELPEDGVSFTVKASGRKLVCTVTRGDGDDATTDTCTFATGGRGPARLEFVRKRGTQRVHKVRF